MQTLTVVNSMIGTLGEVPLASLEEPHAYKGAALEFLNRENRVVQARGWWFNTEELELSPMLNGRIAVANDIIEVRTYSTGVVQRGQYLYDLINGTDIFTTSVKMKAIRVIPFDQLPESVSDYIGWSATLKFQIDYDGDTAKTRQLADCKAEAYVAVRTNDIRNKKVNMIASNPRLVVLHARRNTIPRW